MRFTIRDLLWLMVVVSIAAAWGADRYFLVEAYRGARAGYIFEYNYADRLYLMLEGTGRQPPKRWPRDGEAMKNALEQAARETPEHTRIFK